MKRTLFAVVTLIFVLFTYRPVGATDVVFDPTNLVQNLLQALNGIRQVAQTAEEVRNTARMVQQQAQNLRSLSGSNLSSIIADIDSLYRQLDRIRGMEYELSRIEDNFGDLYSIDGEYREKTRQWENQTRNATYDAMRLQGRIKELVQKSESDLAYTLGASQRATGALEALQALTQGVGVLSGQLNQVVALQAANARALQSEVMEKNTDWQARQAEINRNIQSLKEPMAPRETVSSVPQFQ